jgi:sialate O-acetylesterase
MFPLSDARFAQVWYQGESNEANPLSYNCSFPALISGWRDAWSVGTGGLTDPIFPFGFVQLSIHGGLPCYGSTACYNMPTWSKGYAAIRYAQTASVGTVPNAAMPNVFMATAVDIGEDR